MIIDCISDLHGEFPELEGGDLLIIAGDLTYNDTKCGYAKFMDWVDIELNYKYKKIIVIGGNHDNLVEKFGVEILPTFCTYLKDSKTEFCGTTLDAETRTTKIWGSPWTAQFPRINLHCCAFTVRYHDHTEEILNEYWNKIPSDIDILITHCPPYGILDETREIKFSGFTKQKQNVGSVSLRNQVLSRERFPNLKLHVFGHIHENGGKTFKTNFTTFVNASIMNEDYDPINKPVRIIL